MRKRKIESTVEDGKFQLYVTKKDRGSSFYSGEVEFFFGPSPSRDGRALRVHITTDHPYSTYSIGVPVDVRAVDDMIDMLVDFRETLAEKEEVAE